MACLQASGISISSFPSSSTAIRRPQQHSQLPILKIKSALHVPTSSRTPSPKLPNLKLLQDQLERSMIKDSFIKTKSPYQETITNATDNSTPAQNLSLVKLYALLESISDRIEMHKNIGEQRRDWNTLLLTSINTITLTAATMSAVSESIHPSSPIIAMKASATLLFSAATGLLILMNKIQPSQLVEEQRNAVRLFKQLKSCIETDIALGSVSREGVEEVMEKVLAIDRAYPLPLLGVMIEKYPKQFEPASWWSTKKKSYRITSEGGVHNDKKGGANGWNEKLEEDLREVVKVIKEKDVEDYMRLGNKALGLSKKLAISGPLFTGLAAIGSLCMGQGPWAGILAAVAGSMATVVNTVEHGGQVGMVYEMYRNSAGFFRSVEENIGSLLQESEFGKKENGEVFEMKVALSLGRSLSELRNLAAKSKSLCRDEFASKLF